MAEDQKDEGIVDKAKGTAGDIAGRAAGTASGLAGKAAETASGLVEKAEPLVGKAKEATGDLSAKAEPVLGFGTRPSPSCRSGRDPRRRRRAGSQRTENVR